MLSMFEMTLANWPPITRTMQENVAQWWSLFFVIHKLAVGFAIVGVINGVFMQETFKAAALDDRIMVRQKQRTAALHAKKMQIFFEHADQDGNGVLTHQEFREIASLPEVKVWLGAMDLDAEDTDALFRLLDVDRDGLIQTWELIAGVSRLKGAARSIDLIMLMRDIEDIKNSLETLTPS